MSPEEHRRASAHITAELLGLDRYRSAQTVMAYSTFGSEFSTSGFVEHALRHTKRLVLPRIDRQADRLELHHVQDVETELVPGLWGIREPNSAVCPSVDVTAIDFVLVPGLGFSTRGDRLGYGRGYYDRLLKRRNPKTYLVAAAFTFQVLATLPVDEHDIPIDLMVTEAGVYEGPAQRPIQDPPK